MAAKIKNANPFVLRYALYFSLIVTLFVTSLLYILGLSEPLMIFVFFVLSLISSFLILRVGIENYVLKLIKEVYSEVSLLEGIQFSEGSVTFDLESLTSDIEEFARGKKIEIDTLKIREEYRKDFLGNVAHEMKTPLFTIQGYILTLLDGALQDKKVRKKYLERANKNVNRLLYIVNDLDTITRLESGSQKLRIETTNIVELIESVFEMLEMKAAKKNIKLVFDKVYENPVWINGDAEKLEHVLSNLIENSIKYGQILTKIRRMLCGRWTYACMSNFSSAKHCLTALSTKIQTSSQ